MTASIDYRDFKFAIKRLDTASKTLQDELVKDLHQAASYIHTDMRDRTDTRIERRAFSSVQVTKDADGIAFQGGQGGGLGATLFPGGEFGGKNQKKKVYASRSPNGVVYAVKRRTTMMFKNHKGTQGTFFWPTIRDWWPEKLEKLQKETVERVMGGKS